MLFKCHLQREMSCIYLFGTKEALKRLRSMVNIAMDEFEVRLPNGKENKENYFSCIVLGPANYDTSSEICPVVIAVIR